MILRALAFAAAWVIAAGSAAPAATSPKPSPTATPGPIDVTKIQPRSLAPKRPLHVEYTVEVNKMGQVARVRSVKPSHDEGFDTHTYGNALQTFIRTPDGHVVLGIYRLTYDYDPTSLRVRRDVQLVKEGGVNPNAVGAADDMIAKARRNRNRTPPPLVTPGPIPSVNIHRMPDLPQVMHSPSPRP